MEEEVGPTCKCGHPEDSHVRSGIMWWPCQEEDCECADYESLAQED